MIFDTLSNADKYYVLGEKIKKGFEFLLNSDLINMSDGRHIIDKDEVYANIQTLKTKPIEEQKWEAHRKYIDIQYVIKGKEKMGFGLLKDFDKTILTYDENKDVVFLDGEKYSYVNVYQGNFAIFYPDDVHAPMLNVQNSEEIKKVIVKVKI